MGWAQVLRELCSSQIERPLTQGRHPSGAGQVDVQSLERPRILRLGQHHSPRITYARCGLPAGDMFNDAFVKADALSSFDSFIYRNPDVTLAPYVDDAGINMVGEETHIVRGLKLAALDLRNVFTSGLEV